MRRPVCFAVAIIACCFSTAFVCRLVVAEDDVRGSTIRLVSATEPVHNEPPAATAPRQLPEADRQDPAPVPISTVQVQPTPAVVPAPANTPAPATVAPRPRMPAGLYAGPLARATPNQIPRPTPVQSAPRMAKVRPGGKPFQSVPTQSTVSPYLYLYGASTRGTELSNYFAFVRPQMEQIEASRQQQHEIQQLRSQLQKISSNDGGPQQSSGMNSAARYMDTAQFYHRLQR